MSAVDVAARPAVASLFTGVGGFDLGLERAGFRVVFQCEYEPYRRRVLAHRFPGLPVCPDVRLAGLGRPWVTRIDEDEDSPTHGEPVPIPDGRWNPGTVDLLCGGFPCQDLSVAGLRRGLAGRRSGLFFEFARLADELVRPGGFILLENVPGLLSSNDGRDFAVVLATLAELGFHDLAYRVLDSRHFGVAQRRRRVYVLARRARGRVCREVLLDPDGCAGHPAPSWQAWPRPASAPRGGAAEPRELAATLTSSGNHASRPGRQQSDEYNLVPTDERGVSERIDDGDLTQALTTRFGNSGADLPDAEGNWLVAPDAVRPVTVRTAQAGANGWGVAEDECPTLDGAGPPAVHPGGERDAQESHGGRGGPHDGRRADLGARTPDAVREGAGSPQRGGRRVVEGGAGEPDAERLRGRGGEGLDGGGERRGGSPADADGVRAPAGVPGRLDDRAAQGEVDAYAVRGRDGGAAVEPIDLPNLRGHTGKDGGADGRRRAGLNELSARETDEAESLTAVGPGRRSDRGTMIVGSDAALAERLERDGYLPPVPWDPGKPVAPDGQRYAAMGDAVTVNVIEWIGVRLGHAIERDRLLVLG